MPAVARETSQGKSNVLAHPDIAPAPDTTTIKVLRGGRTADSNALNGVAAQHARIEAMFAADDDVVRYSRIFRVLFLLGSSSLAWAGIISGAAKLIAR